MCNFNTRVYACETITSLMDETLINNHYLITVVI